jgi:type II pantothenate kinase
METLPSGDLDAVAARLDGLAPEALGVTGCGAAALSDRVVASTTPINEFAAWGAGARRLMGTPASGRHLLVSVGTGTSVLLLDQFQSNRVGGTALGGGTVLGLGSALAGTDDFVELCELAARGDAGTVDLRVGDIYRPGEIPLSGDATASAFAKLAHHKGAGGAPTHADQAAAIMNLVGENVALICVGLAAAAQVNRVVYGGSTLRENPVLVAALLTITTAFGRESSVLHHGEFSGAVGSLELVSS